MNNANPNLKTAFQLWTKANPECPFQLQNSFGAGSMQMLYLTCRKCSDRYYNQPIFNTEDSKGNKTTAKIS
jgi:hypothetical protein